MGKAFGPVADLPEEAAASDLLLRLHRAGVPVEEQELVAARETFGEG